MIHLNDGSRLILRTIDDAGGEMTTSDMKDDEELMDHYSGSSLRKALSRLVDHEPPLLEKEQTTPRNYILTREGRQALRKENEKKRRQLMDTGENEPVLSFEDAVNQFTEFFNTDPINTELGEAVAAGESPYVIDYQALERFDTELADQIVEEPEELLNAARVAASRLPVVEDDLPVIIRNLPEHQQKEIREIEISDIGRLVSVTGIVLKASMIKAMVTEATFRCTACGDIRDKEQNPGEKIKSPYKCDCGNRKWERIGLTREPVRILKMQEKPDSPDQKPIKVRIEGEFAESEIVREMRPGTAVKVTAIVDAEGQRDNSGLQDPFLKGLYVDAEQSKWEEVNLTEQDHERNAEIAEEGAVNALWDSVAADRLVHRKLMRQAFVLYLLGKTQKGNMHALVFGDPGTGKTELAKWAEEYLPQAITADATKASVVGLTATVKEDPDFGGYVAEGGSLTLADGGYHLVDEFSHLEDNHYKQFNEALEHEVVSVDKGDIKNLKLDASISEWATSNLRNADRLDDRDPAYKQIPIPPDQDSIKQRFDLLVAVREYPADSQEQQDVLEHMARNDEEDWDGVDAEYSPEEIIKFVAEANSTNPVISTEARELLYEQYQSLKKSEKDGEHLISTRGYRALLKLSIAFARSELADTVEEQHAKQACQFFRRTLESMDFTLGDDSFSDVQSSGKTDREKVKAAVEDLVESNDEDLAPIEDIAKETGFAIDRVEDILKKGAKKGEFYTPQSGMWDIP